MKKILNILCVSILTFWSLVSSAQDSKSELQDAEKNAADERTRAFGGRRTSETFNPRKPVGQNNTGDAKNKNSDNDSASDQQKRSSQVITTNEDQDEAGQPSNESSGSVNEDQSAKKAGDDEQKTNAPAVIQTTTSESGSPAILSDNNGEGRDGTNNKQRGSYKMAGADIKGDLGLSQKDASERNIKETKKIVKQEERPALVDERTDRDEGDLKNEAQVESQNQPKQESQNVTPEKKQTKKEKSRSRKSKKSRDRDSG